MRIVYDGPFDEVEIVESGQMAKRGEPVEVDAALAARLLEQSTWTKAGGKP